MPLGLNLFGPRYGFEGGLFLSDHKTVTARLPIETLTVDGPLHVPLQAAADRPTRPVVSIGERVLWGDLLAAPQGAESVGVFAPTSGSVTAFSRAWSPLDGFLPCAVLEPDGRNERVRPRLAWDEDSFTDLLAGHGAMCPRPRVPAHVRIRAAIAAGATTLIIDAMETEPYLTADLRTLVEMPGRVVDVTCEIADAIGAGRVLIAVPDRHRRVLKRIASEAVGRYVEVIALPDKYPQCDPIILTKTLLDLEVPPGGDPLDLGVLVLPLGATRGIADAVFDDRPTTHVLITVAGDAVERRGTFLAPIGLPVERLAQRVGLRGEVRTAVCGGPLTGVEITRSDSVITSTTVAILLFAGEPAHRPMPCVHCGWCVEDCPVGLDPVSLAQLELQATVDPAVVPELRACVDCGLCSYVCPSRLPLAATIARTRDRFAGKAEARP